jgi:hypothetical protein
MSGSCLIVSGSVGAVIQVFLAAGMYAEQASSSSW